MPAPPLTTLIRRLQDWADKPANARYYRDGQILQIEAALADPRRTTQLSIAAWMLGTWYLGSGQARVLRTDLGGWDDVRLGLCFQRTSLLLRGQRGSRRPRGGDVPDLPVLHSANCAAIGLSLGDPDGEHLFAMHRDLPDRCFAEHDAWPLFVRELLALRAGERPVVTPRLGLYADVLMHWHGDEELLARRLAALLDHHLERTRTTPELTAEFEDPGVLLLPVEVMSVSAVRADLELAMPKVEHPLMFTNLLNSSPRGPWPTDPLLQRIANAVR